MQSNKGACMRLGFFQFKSRLRALRLGCHRESGSKEYMQGGVGRTSKSRKPRPWKRSLFLNVRRAHNRWPLSLQSWWSYPEPMIQTPEFEDCSSSSQRQRQNRPTSICYSPWPPRSTHQRQTVPLVLSLQIQLAHFMKVLSISHTSRTPKA